MTSGNVIGVSGSFICSTKPKIIMRQEIYSIPGKMSGSHDLQINAIIDSWQNLLVSLDDFKKTIFDKGILYASQNGVQTWIVDTSNALGTFKPDIQEFIEGTVAPKCSDIGIKYFFVVLPKSAISRLSARKVANINANQEGMQTIEVGSVDEALTLLKGE